MIKTLSRFIAVAVIALAPSLAHAFSAVRQVQISTNTLTRQTGTAVVAGIDVSTATISSGTITNATLGVSSMTTTLPMSARKITGLANGSVSTDAAAFGQIPTITNWAAYTPTIAGFGTVSSVSFRWKQIGDTTYVSGLFQSGTTAGTVASITLPNSFSIVYGASGMSGNQDLIGMWMSSKTELTFGQSDAGGLTTDGSTTDKIFFARSGSTTANFPKENGSSISGSTNYVAVNFWFVHN
jgi:hypothetical protein